MFLTSTVANFYWSHSQWHGVPCRGLLHLTLMTTLWDRDYYYYYLIEVYLTYDIRLASGEQHSFLTIKHIMKLSLWQIGSIIFNLLIPDEKRETERSYMVWQKVMQLVSGRCKFQIQMILLSNLLLCHIKDYSSCISPLDSVWDLFPVWWALSLVSAVEWLTHKLETGLTPTENGVHCPGQKLSGSQERKCYSAKPFPLWQPWCIFNREQGQPVIHHQPKSCLQFLIPVIEDMCYSANSTDGKWLIVLPLWAWEMRGKRRREGRRLYIFIFLC